MAVLLVRHAEAGPSPDELRVLDDLGRRQADRIAAVLGERPVDRILSSRYVRCVETITPLAERLGLPVEQHEALCEEADVDDAWALLESVAGTETVVCSHGNILSPILDRVLRRGAEIVADEWSCRKASIWMLEPDADRTFGRATLLG